MIIIEKPTWIRIVFRVHGSTLSKTWSRMLFTTLVAIAVTVAYQLDLRYTSETITPLPFSLIGLAVSIFLGFRNNTSYDRFWEGRKLWGRIVNSSRTLTRQILTLVGPEELDDEARAMRKAMVYRVIAYVHALRLHLRDDRDMEELRPFLSDEDFASLENELNRPIALLQIIGDELRQCWRRGWIHPLHLTTLERTLTELTDVQGGCERIKSTPIPFSYNILLHRIVAVYCTALPLGIIETTGLATPLVVLMVSYAFFGLDAVGDEIENPFGTDPNDLPLSAITRMIEHNLRQRLHETELPPLRRPDDRDILI